MNEKFRTGGFFDVWKRADNLLGLIFRPSTCSYSQYSCLSCFRMKTSYAGDSVRHSQVSFSERGRLDNDPKRSDKSSSIISSFEAFLSV
jgi:hypothetical protein